jgi:hypothetical protein
MDLVQKIDDLGKPAWIALMIVSFIIFWPIGLAVLIYLIWSGRMGFWRQSDTASRVGHGCGWRHHHHHRASPTGNRVFDEYRAETLRRLEEEQKEFTDFLERLRQARDKSEFDQFMAERRQRSSGTEDSQAADPKSAA